ncbi:hypothetical protein BDR07DRAFT_1401906 [Suillus spraguei]|nr:hypothetical protein BDR07DRAFT_1401906 [Suillus spraguei]
MASYYIFHLEFYDSMSSSCKHAYTNRPWTTDQITSNLTDSVCCRMIAMIKLSRSAWPNVQHLLGSCALYIVLPGAGRGRLGTQIEETLKAPSQLYVLPVTPEFRPPRTGTCMTSPEWKKFESFSINPLGRAQDADISALLTVLNGGGLKSEAGAQVLW